MKKSELGFNVASVPLDFLMLFGAAVGAFFLRKNPAIYSKPIAYTLDLGDFLLVAVKILPALVLILAFLGMYGIRGRRKLLFEFKQIVIAVSLGLLLVMLFFFFDQTIFPSRFIILVTWFLGIIFLLLGRVFLKVTQELLFKKGVGLHKLVLVGEGKDSEKIQKKFEQDPTYGYAVVDRVAYSDNIWVRLEKIYSEKKFDELMLADLDLGKEESLRLLEFARNNGILYSFLPGAFDVRRNVMEVVRLGSMPVIFLKNTPLDGWGRVLKRFLDILFSCICLVLTSPLFFLVALAVKLDSRGSVIYSAFRGGQGKDFRFYKFRTMYQHLSVGENYGGQKAEEVRQRLWEKNSRGGKDGPFLKIKDDPRVTRIGKFLRKTKLDEIPQFLNVLKGDMSMVGPRAHVLDEVGRYKNSYRRMFSIKPGIFGLSQIAQFAWPDLPFEEEIRLNTYYIENWSVWLDVKILVKSFWLLIFARKPRDNY